MQLPTGNTAYTRDGSFQISDQGVLVTSDGYQIGAGIKIPAEVTDVTISATGVVSGSKGQGGETEELGRIELARFANPSGMEAMGQNLFAATPASGEATTGYPQDDGFGRLVQGQLEGSNVEIVQEMVDMISAQRAYETQLEGREGRRRDVADGDGDGSLMRALVFLAATAVAGAPWLVFAQTNGRAQSSPLRRSPTRRSQAMELRRATRRSRGSVSRWRRARSRAAPCSSAMTSRFATRRCA